MAGRFAPPPTVRAYARRRLAVLRTMHRSPTARRFPPSPYAGADAPRLHLPLQFHCSCPQPQRWPSMLRRPDPRHANQSTHSVSSERIADFLGIPTFVGPEATVFRIIRKLRSSISIPHAFNTSNTCATLTAFPVVQEACHVGGWYARCGHLIRRKFRQSGIDLPKSIAAALICPASKSCPPRASRLHVQVPICD